MCKLFVIVVGVFSFFVSGCNRKTPSDVQAPKGMVVISAGEFFMGIDNQSVLLPVMSNEMESKDAMPLHTRYLDKYFIDPFETTYGRYAQYKTLLQEYLEGKKNYPVSGIGWNEADEFCRWSGKRLPTEAEWEKAARGTDGRKYPWGNDFDRQFANLGQKLMKIGSVIKDRSPYGLFDMAGNVSEWIAGWYSPYPGAIFDAGLYKKQYRVSRGGSFSKSETHSYQEIFSQVTFRHVSPPDTAAFDTGFRCAKSE